MTDNFQILKRRGVRLVLLIVVGATTLFLGFDGLTKNWADLEVGAKDPSLEAVSLPISDRAQAIEHAVAAIRSLPRWRVEASDLSGGTIHATRTTRLWRFVDDVHLKVIPIGKGMTILGQSRSRVGRGDLGQNTRNLRELARALRQAR